MSSVQRKSRIFLVRASVAAIALVGGCSSGSTDGEPSDVVAASVSAAPLEPAPVDVDPPRRPQEDLCDRVDYSVGSAVFGEDSPRPYGRTTVSEEDHLRCVESYEDGHASVDIRIHDSEAAATEAFEVVAIYVTVAPYPGADELAADQLQFRQVDDRNVVELRVENLFVEVSLTPTGSRDDDVEPFTSEVQAAATALAKSVLEVLSETE